MQIIGGKDYYDYGAAFGVDKLRVFERKERIISADEYSQLNTGVKMNIGRAFNVYYLHKPSGKSENVFHRCSSRFEMRSYPVFFAGKVYYGIYVFDAKDYNLSRFNRFFWNMEEFNVWYELGTPKGKFTSKKILAGEHWFLGETPTFKVVELNNKQVDSFVENKISIMYPHPDDWKNISINGCALQDIRFATCLDATQAFQLLDQWVGGRLIQGQPMIQLEDKYKIAKHGMDETSFRKPKEK